AAPVRARRGATTRRLRSTLPRTPGSRRRRRTPPSRPRRRRARVRARTACRSRCRTTHGRDARARSRRARARSPRPGSRRGPAGRGEDVRRALPVERDADAAGGEGPFDRAGDRVAPAIGTGRVGRAHLEVLAWDRDRDRSSVDTLDRLRLATSVANQVGGVRRGSGAGLPPEIPCDEGPVAALPDVQRVSHRPIEIALETV